MNRVICKGAETPSGVMFKLRENDKVVYKQIPFANYFYISQKDFEDVELLIKDKFKDFQIVTDSNNKRCVKLILNNNYHRNFIKKELEEKYSIKTYEADINSVKRFLIHNQKIELNQDKLRYAFMDIETYDIGELEKDFKGNILANKPMLSIAIKDLDGNIFYKENPANIENIEENTMQLIDALTEGEENLLEWYFEQCKKYDVMMAWNGNRFDFPYIQQRSELHNLEEDYKRTMIINIDYMEVYKRNSWDSLKSFSLQNVSLHEFKDEVNNKESKFVGLEEVQKVDWKERSDCKYIFEMFRDEKELLKEYNIQDVNLMFLLEKKLDFLAIQQIISKECHCPIQDSMWNSHAFDYAMLNQYHTRNIIAPSKPTYQEKVDREHVYIGGGYTNIFDKGVFKEVHAFDEKSFYPTTVITFNISPETLVKNINPKLDNVFNEKELEYIIYCCNQSKEYLNAKGCLNKNKYEKDIEAKRLELDVDDMNTLMWRFIREYKNEELEKYCKDNDLIFTPTDINYDTRGWEIHPHRIYLRKEGVFPYLSKHFIQTRDKVKYELKQYDKSSHEYKAKNLYQISMKTLGNSGYGVFLFKSFRFFNKDIGDSITTSCRYIIKKSIAFANDNECKVLLTDTDSAYMQSFKHDVNKLNEMFYNFYDEVIKSYNTCCQIEHINPVTKEKEIKNHFLIFEHEKTLDSCIIVAKKKYYFKMRK